MRTLLLGSLLALITLPVLAQDQSARLRKLLLSPESETVLVAAHRASHRDFPENSIPAIRHAIQTGVDIIEIDVKTSADGIPFLMHDRTINRTTTGKGDPEKMSWQALRSLFLLHKGQPTEERIPTLEEALLETKGKILVDLDMKTDDVEAVVEVIQKTGTQETVFIFDGDPEVLKRVRKISKLMVMPRGDDLASAREMLNAFSPVVLHIDPTFNTAETAGLIKSKKARIWINALGETDQAIASGLGRPALEPLLAHGANIVQTDEPQLLKGLLHQMGKRPDFAGDLTGRPEKKMLYTAHRSNWRRRAPESTTGSMREALARGANYLEVDVRTTKDNEIVIMHDGTLKRTTNLKGAVKDLTLQEIRQAHVKRSGKQRVPTLKEVTEVVSEWNRTQAVPASLYVDCKNADPKQLIEILKARDLVRHSVFYGSDDFLSRLREIEPDARIMPALRSASELEGKAARLRPYAFDVDWKQLDEALVESVHAYGIRVFTDLLVFHDKRKNYRKAAEIGVDVIQTDRLKQALKGK